MIVESQKTDVKTDVIIIGAGPVGLFAIFQCGMMGLKCHVMDALDSVGGQCAALYPEKPIYDIPAYPMITGGDLIEALKKQAAPFNPTYHLGQQVVSVDFLDNSSCWRVETEKKIIVEAKALMIAAGVGAFGPNRPPLPGIESFENQSVFYYVRHRELFKDKRVVIAGGGDTAVDWALSLSEIAEHIYFVHRRDKFRAAPESLHKLQDLSCSGKVEMVVPYHLHGLEGEAGALSRVVVKTLEGEERALDAQYLLPFFGLSMSLGPIAQWGLNLDQKHILVDPATAATDKKGIYAIGDVATYPGKLKLILTGFAEAAQAAHSIRSLIHPDQVFHFEYSTTQGLPS